MVEVSAPARVDLAGGTLDLWPLHCFYPGAMTVNVALRCAVRIRLQRGSAAHGAIRYRAPGRAHEELRPRDAGHKLTAAVGFHFLPDGGVTVEVLAQPPLGSGLGGSSAYAVALARACLRLAGRRMATAALIATLRDLEVRVLGVPTGVQDYYPALLGGVLAIHFEPGCERAERLPVAREWVAERLLVLFTGVAHASGSINWEVYRARLGGDRRVSAALANIADAARACRAALVSADEKAVGEAIAAEWQARRRLAPVVATPQLDAIIAAGVRAGAHAAKACGAGGGGSVAFWVPPARRSDVLRAALAQASEGALEISSDLAARGARQRTAAGIRA
jgi:D-glycero-alpha-D-manno-heptose-7-phosphate kinase